MKPTALLLAALTATATAAPTDYPPPPGGWDSLTYPPPPGGWSSVAYPPGTGESPTCQTGLYPFAFTSVHTVHATPDQVVNGTAPTGGLAGASATFRFGLDAASNTVCYNITLRGFRGDYQSPARTATHIHEAARGASGPPRIAFPNPVDVAGQEGVRRSVGCVTGPFETGVVMGGQDTGTGFHVSSIEADPAKFFADVHSSLAVPGAVRGQLA